MVLRPFQQRQPLRLQRLLNPKQRTYQTERLIRQPPDLPPRQPPKAPAAGLSSHRARCPDNATRRAAGLAILAQLPGNRAGHQLIVFLQRRAQSTAAPALARCCLRLIISPGASTGNHRCPQRQRHHHNPQLSANVTRVPHRPNPKPSFTAANSSAACRPAHNPVNHRRFCIKISPIRVIQPAEPPATRQPPSSYTPPAPTTDTAILPSSSAAGPASPAAPRTAPANTIPYPIWTTDQQRTADPGANKFQQPQIRPTASISVNAITTRQAWTPDGGLECPEPSDQCRFAHSHDVAAASTWPVTPNETARRRP